MFKCELVFHIVSVHPCPLQCIIAGVVSNLLFKYPVLLPVSTTQSKAKKRLKTIS